MKCLKAQTYAEYLILVPFVTLLVLCTFQAALLINAHIAVKHAAYRAARSIIVNINSGTLEDSLSKMEQSAALALLSICPVPAVSLKGLKLISSGKLNSEILGFSPFFGINPTELAARYEYAHQHLKVYIREPDDLLKIERGSKIIVRVDFLYNLHVPLAGRLFYEIISRQKNLALIHEHLSGEKTVKISKTATMHSEN